MLAPTTRTMFHTTSSMPVCVCVCFDRCCRCRCRCCCPSSRHDLSDNTSFQRGNRNVEVFLNNVEATMRFSFDQLSRMPPGGVKWPPGQGPSIPMPAKKTVSVVARGHKAMVQRDGIYGQGEYAHEHEDTGPRRTGFYEYGSENKMYSSIYAYDSREEKKRKNVGCMVRGPQKAKRSVRPRVVVLCVSVCMCGRQEGREIENAPFGLLAACLGVQ